MNYLDSFQLSGKHLVCSLYCLFRIKRQRLNRVFLYYRNAYFQVSGDPVQEGMQKKKQLKKQLVTSPLRSQSEMLAKQSDITVLDDPR